MSDPRDMAVTLLMADLLVELVPVQIPPEKAIRVTTMLWEHAPEPRPPLDIYLVGLMAYLRFADEWAEFEDGRGGRLGSYVRESCRIQLDDERAMELRSWKGAMQLLSFPTVDAWAEAFTRRSELMVEGLEVGEWSPWTCLFCGRGWEDGTEPDSCPDCDHPLSRLQKRKREETT